MKDPDAQIARQLSNLIRKVQWVFYACINARLVSDLDKLNLSMVEQRALTGSVRMARNGSYVAAFLVAVLCTFLRDADALNTTLTYTLGFLAPSADSVIPASLANEW